MRLLITWILKLYYSATIERGLSLHTEVKRAIVV